MHNVRKQLNISYANFSMASIENILFNNSNLGNSSFQENKLKDIKGEIINQFQAIDLLYLLGVKVKS